MIRVPWADHYLNSYNLLPNDEVQPEVNMVHLKQLANMFARFNV